MVREKKPIGLFPFILRILREVIKGPLARIVKRLFYECQLLTD